MAAAGVRVVGPDRVVIRSADPVASAEWWSKVVGLSTLRLEEFKAGKAPFPSVRVSPSFIIDFAGEEMARIAAGARSAAGGAAATSSTTDPADGGAPKPAPPPPDAPQAVAAPASGQLDHMCLALEDGQDMQEVERKLREAGAEPLVQFDGGTVVRRFGARGVALSVYVRTPEGVTLELRSYPEAGGA